MKSKILFAVHRYAPFPGGSETNVKNMAEEMLRRGHDVTVVAASQSGDHNGVKVTGDHNVLLDKWDLIIVHGGDVITQNIVHANAERLQSPVLYLIIKPSESEICLHGLKAHKYLGYGTSFDLDLIKKYGLENKARQVRYGLPIEDTIFPYDKNAHPFPGKRMFISIGGFAGHKRMRPLADAFKAAKIPDAVLVILGYDGGDVPDGSENVAVAVGAPKSAVMSLVAMSDALIMNSSEEGFGLVLLEAMMNRTPWFARDIAGAHDMRIYGSIYNTEEELMERLRAFDREKIQIQIDAAYSYVMANHTIQTCVDDIERILSEHN